MNYATTLLAAADASVGGKTAVDTPLATNLIGLFNQPKKVYLDIDTWKTLPEKQLSSGLAETIKHGCLGDTQLIVSNLYLEDYEQMHADWNYLQEEFPALFQVTDVLEQYTSLRYQTKIDRETGTAADTSLHNMRVVDEGLSFEGHCCVQNGNRRALEILALALRNLSQSGLKRTRGFGRIACTMEQDGKDLLRPILREILTAAERSL